MNKAHRNLQKGRIKLVQTESTALLVLPARDATDEVHF